MLVVSRRIGEKIVIGEGITVTVTSVHGNRVRLGIKAPDDVRVLRKELACWQDANSHDGQLISKAAAEQIPSRK
jgi:carbon storage regulator CsrA